MDREFFLDADGLLPDMFPGGPGYGNSRLQIGRVGIEDFFTGIAYGSRDPIS